MAKAAGVRRVGASFKPPGASWLGRLSWRDPGGWAVREDRERRAEIEWRSEERRERQKASNPVLEREVEHGSESGL
jgi:hypothetical protein